MLSLVTAAEQLHRFDTAARDREQLLLLSIRARAAAEPLDRALREAPKRVAPVAALWPRPIGVASAACCAAA